MIRKPISDAIKAVKKDKKKRPDGKTIHSYTTQHNAINLDDCAIKPSLEENLLKGAFSGLRQFLATEHRLTL